MLLKVIKVLAALPVATLFLATFMLVLGWVSNGFCLVRCSDAIIMPRTVDAVCKQDEPAPNSGIIKFLRSFESDPRAGSASGRAIIYLEAIDDRTSLQ